MALDNATLAQLLGGNSTSGAPSWTNSAGLLGNYLLQQGATRPAVSSTPAQPQQLGGARQTSPFATNPYQAANPYQTANPYQGAATGAAGTGAATGGTGTSAYGNLDPLTLALLRAKLAQGMSGTGSGGFGF